MIRTSIKHKNNMDRPTIIAGNWKMHKTIAEAVAFIEAIRPQVEKAKSQIWIAPPFTAIERCVQRAKGANIKIGAQNMSDQDEGAFTGEVSARMLKEAGAQFVILGHSERRTHFKETNEKIHHKVKRATLENLPCILCIGESLEDREKNRFENVLTSQLDAALAGLNAETLKDLVLAYEPVWAIGTGKTATPELAEEAHKLIREHIGKTKGSKFANSLPILYGGSVKPDNIAKLLQMPNIDGALIGGASLDATAFTQMVMQ